MKHTLTLLSALLVLDAGNAIASPKRLQIPQSALPAGVSAERLNRRLEQLQFIPFEHSGMASKTTANERLIKQVSYDNANQQSYSLMFVYSNGRGSSFDLPCLCYDVFNTHDFIFPYDVGKSNVNYDTLRAHGQGFPKDVVHRSYNGAGRVAREEGGMNPLSLFEYNAANKTTKITHFDLNGSSWDSSHRDFFKYDGFGRLVQDSAEYYNKTTKSWMQEMNYNYTTDVNGRPTRIDCDVPTGGGNYQTIARITYSYNGASGDPKMILCQSVNALGTTLENYRKDTFSYSGSASIAHDIYDWDTTAKAWSIYNQERRYLNGAGLPDSVFNRSWNQGKPADSIYKKLAYTAQNNPTYRRTFFFGNNVPIEETRWWYDTVVTAGIGRVGAYKLELYPNPASNKIQLKGLSEGNYTIYNTAGQMLQSGRLEGGGSIAVQHLIPGMYRLNVIDAKGQPYSATFFRQ